MHYLETVKQPEVKPSDIFDSSKMLQAMVNGEKDQLGRSLKQLRIKHKISAAISKAPQAVEAMKASSTDAIHGTTSANLLDILRYGVVPTALHESLGILAIGKEHFTLPEKRQSNHFVHWIYADQLKRYAEDRITGTDYISFSNYQEVAETPDNVLGMVNPALSVGSLVLGRVKEARALQSRIALGHYSNEELSLIQDVFPVIVGVSTGLIDDDKIAPVNSTIDGDCQIKGIIKTSQISSLWVPSQNIKLVEASVRSAGIEVFNLDVLRQLPA